MGGAELPADRGPSPSFPLKGSLKEGIDMGIDIGVDMDTDSEKAAFINCGPVSWGPYNRIPTIRRLYEGPLFLEAPISWVRL